METTVIKETTIKITLSEALKKRSIIAAVLLSYKTKELSSALKSKLMSARIAVGRIEKQFTEERKEAAVGFKPEGFEDRLKEVREFEDVLNKNHPDQKIEKLLSSTELTDEEKKGIEKRKAFMEEYQKWNIQCADFESEKLKEKVDYTPVKFTQEEFNEILDVNSKEKYELQLPGDVDGVTRMMPAYTTSENFMELFYGEFV